jgi:DNA mismatch endonuclease, patch repair protein
MPSHDPLSSEERSERMSRIRNADTKPEMVVRGLVYGMGYRYRLHRKDLPGKPDLVFQSRHKVIFVHGCFWHQHGCSQYRMPRSKLDFWEPKLEGNRARDIRVRNALDMLGWQSLVVWECELKDMDALRQRVRVFLEIV